MFAGWNPTLSAPYLDSALGDSEQVGGFGGRQRASVVSLSCHVISIAAAEQDGKGNRFDGFARRAYTTAMTEHKIASRIRSSREKVQEVIGSQERYEAPLVFVSYGLVAFGVLLATLMGIGGKPVAETIGTALSASTEPQEVVATGWRLSCIGVALLVAVGHGLSRYQSHIAQRLARARMLRASLKNLTVDLEDHERDHHEVTRDYQRLTEQYAEFVD